MEQSSSSPQLQELQARTQFSPRDVLLLGIESAPQRVQQV